MPTILRKHRAVGVPLNTGNERIPNENQSLYAWAAVTNVRTSGVKLMAADIVAIRSRSVIRRSAGAAHEQGDKRHAPR